MTTKFECQVGSAAASRHPSLLSAAKYLPALTLLVFSMTDRAGFDQIAKQYAEIEHTLCIIVGTKCDHVPSWAVTTVG